MRSIVGLLHAGTWRSLKHGLWLKLPAGMRPSLCTCPGRATAAAQKARVCGAVSGGSTGTDGVATS
jgi:hypothetical protein